METALCNIVKSGGSLYTKQKNLIKIYKKAVVF